MKQSRKVNSGFSLIELIIALAVMAFLMLAVSSFMGSSIMQSKKAKVDVRMQMKAQETYSLITDTLMQASEVVIVGYTSSADLSFSNPGAATSETLTKKYFVRDEETKKILTDSTYAGIREKKYGITSGVDAASVVLFSEVDPDDKIYISQLTVLSSVPIDMDSVTGGNSSVVSSQTLTNALTGEATMIDCTEVTTGGTAEKVYSVNDTLVSTFCFEDENLYYGRTYAFMDKLNDTLDMGDDSSRRAHLYNQYFSYQVASVGAADTGVSGCVATVNASDSTIGINLYYNQTNMTYTTLGRINIRNSYVLRAKN